MSTDLLPALTARARVAVHPLAPGAAPCACPEPGTVLADRGDAIVVRHGAVVAKAHAVGTDTAQLALRLAVAAHPALTGVLLAPLRPSSPVSPPSPPDPLRPPSPPSPHASALFDRPVTLWPHGVPVDPGTAPEDAPWEAAGSLLARLHRVDTAVLPGPLPEMRGPAKAARAVARLRAAGEHPGAAPVLRAWATLPGWARAEAAMPQGVLCHGDLHLGQLVRCTDGEASWRLIDVDDLGTGVPAWDLARPAALFACGALGPEEWTRFLAAYRAAGGPAVPAEGDPWVALDVPARALSVQAAALAIVKAAAARRALDEVEQALVEACDRMADVPVAGDGTGVGGAPEETVPARPAALPGEGGRGAAK